MDRYYKRYILPALKKYNLTVEDIIAKSEKHKSIARAFFPSDDATPEEWYKARVMRHIAYYVVFGAKLFDVKEKVIADYVNASKGRGK